MLIYVAGAWTEQHQRARPMIARLREAGHTITCDWTQAEGDVCACGHGRKEHAPHAPVREYTGWRVDGSTRCERSCPTGHVGDVERCPCRAYNGIGVGGDSKLSPEDRKRFAQADLDGVLSADIVWLLAANDKGACGSWVELGAALTAKQNPDRLLGWPVIIVSGPKWNRTIFTELADKTFPTDEEAFKYILSFAAKP